MAPVPVISTSAGILICLKVDFLRRVLRPADYARGGLSDIEVIAAPVPDVASDLRASAFTDSEKLIFAPQQPDTSRRTGQNRLTRRKDG